MERNMAVPNADEVRDVIRENVYDPEIGLNVVDLGLIYDVDIEQVEEKNKAHITMTLTSPGCPVGPHIIGGIQNSVHKQYPELDEINIHVVWDPLWNPDMMTQEAKDLLGFF
jgi:metal-sulfur cluster biosynthetic enzyme